jgi:hypothetical protein
MESGARAADSTTFEQAGVEEICSVADHVAKRPTGWESRWDFNRACCYDSEAVALATARGEDGFQLLAYALVDRKGRRRCESRRRLSLERRRWRTPRRCGRRRQ